MEYVLGNNQVSYFVSYVLNIPLVKHKTLEKMDSNHGQEIIPPTLFDFVKNIFNECSILDYERFYNDRGKFTSKKPKNFSNLYSLYTRGKTTPETSYLKQLDKYQKYVSIQGLGPEDSFKLLFKKIEESVNKNCIDKQLISIEYPQKLSFSDLEITFKRLISTINLVDLVELDSSGKIRNSIIDNYSLDGFNLPHTDKFIYVCKLQSEEDIVLSGIYKQVLATGQPYYRKTYNKNIVIYECMRNIYDKAIDGNEIINYIETTQISDNLDIQKVIGIDLIGKFSQWKENTSLETIYSRCMELKEFYNIGENNHKKVL
tara:strand:+ start:1504 stop:2451 length:948 start_codon:yes stop_codon:yes gene_type:complete